MSVPNPSARGAGGRGRLERDDLVGRVGGFAIFPQTHRSSALRTQTAHGPIELSVLAETLPLGLRAAGFPLSVSEELRRLLQHPFAALSRASGRQLKRGMS